MLKYTHQIFRVFHYKATSKSLYPRKLFNHFTITQNHIKYYITIHQLTYVIKNNLKITLNTEKIHVTYKWTKIRYTEALEGTCKQCEGLDNTNERTIVSNFLPVTMVGLWSRYWYLLWSSMYSFIYFSKQFFQKGFLCKNSVHECYKFNMSVKVSHQFHAIQNVNIVILTLNFLNNNLFKIECILLHFDNATTRWGCLAIIEIP